MRYGKLNDYSLSMQTPHYYVIIIVANTGATDDSNDTLVGPLSGQRSIDEMLYRKSLKFVYSVMNSNNSIVAHIGQLIRQSAKSPIGGNVACFK